jgi:hypothetical protein
MKHGRCVVPKCASRAFRLAEHVVSARGGKLNAGMWCIVAVSNTESESSFRIGVKAPDEERHRACKC